MNISDIVAQILAKEKLIIVRNGETTASADLHARILYLPQWSSTVSKDIETYFTLHEVAHFLHSPNLEEVSIEFNIIEDIRVEALFKKEYPGSRQLFADGAKELFDSGLFGCDRTTVNQMSFLDKLNIYAKVGVYSGIAFDDKEWELVSKYLSVRDLDVAYEYAEEIANSIQCQRIRVGGRIMGELDIGPQEIGLSTDSENFEYVGSSVNSTIEPNSQPEQEVAAATSYDAINDYMQSNVVDSKVLTVTVGSMTKEYTNYCIIPKESLYRTELSTEDINAVAGTFFASKKSTVDAMYREFERRKNALISKYDKITNTGKINTRKLYSYPVNDNIFLQKVLKAEGKSHSFFFMVDFSASMDFMLPSFLEQLYICTDFCRKANIHFKVVGFTNELRIESWEERDERITKLKQIQKMDCGSTEINAVGIYPLFDSLLSNVEYTRVTKELYARATKRMVSLSGTPTVSALFACENVAMDFFNKTQADVRNFVIMTDGAANDSLHDSSSYNKRHYSRIDLVDLKTHQTYENGIGYSAMTGTAYSIIKNRLNCNLIHIHLFPRNGYSDAMNASTYSHLSYSSEDEKRYRANLRRDSFFKLDGLRGCDTALMIRISAIDLVDVDVISTLNIDWFGNTSKNIAKTLIKEYKKEKVSKSLIRALAESFTPEIRQ